MAAARQPLAAIAVAASRSWCMPTPSSFTRKVAPLVRRGRVHLDVENPRADTPPDGVPGWLEVPVTCRRLGAFVVLPPRLRSAPLVHDYRVQPHSSPILGWIDANPRAPVLAFLA